jgi:hypothetical protein
MSEETKKAEQIEQEAKSTELSEQDLDNVAGGGANDGIVGVGVGLGKHQHLSAAVTKKYNVKSQSSA